MPELLLAYVMTATDSNHAAYLGTVMVTDARGLPREFRHTEPIRPTRIQRVLYGGALEAYLRADVIGSCLLKDLKAKPTAVVVREEALLALDQQAGCPVLVVFATNLDPLPDGEPRRDIDEKSVLVQLAPGSGPVRVTVARPDASLLAAACEILLGAAETMDVVEPLTRMEEAVSLLWAEAEKAES